jgi:hypothetical protein
MSNTTLHSTDKWLAILAADWLAILAADWIESELPRDAKPNMHSV